jgi:hypothetical protein
MNSTSFILILIGIVLVVLLWIQKRKNAKIDNTTMKLRVPRGPMSLPLVGNLVQLGDRPYEKMLKWSKKYGPVYRVRLGSQEVVVLNGTEIIRDALINHSEGISIKCKYRMYECIMLFKFIQNLFILII